MTTISESISDKTIYGKSIETLLSTTLPKYLYDLQDFVNSNLSDSEINPLLKIKPNSDADDVFDKLVEILDIAEMIKDSAKTISDLCNDILDNMSDVGFDKKY